MACERAGQALSIASAQALGKVASPGGVAGCHATRVTIFGGRKYGTKVKAPRTAGNKQAFAVAARNNNRKGKRYKDKAAASKATTVQLLMTVFWHLGTGLPLRWKIAGSAGSERKATEEMVNQLPANHDRVGNRRRAY